MAGIHRNGDGLLQVLPGKVAPDKREHDQDCEDQLGSHRAMIPRPGGRVSTPENFRPARWQSAAACGISGDCGNEIGLGTPVTKERDHENAKREFHNGRCRERHLPNVFRGFAFSRSRGLVKRDRP